MQGIGPAFSRCAAAAARVLLLTLVFTPVYAGPLGTTIRALNDGFGPDAGRWHGSLVLFDDALGDTLFAEVDWAVFARPDSGIGKFQQFLNDEGIPQVDPSGPGDLIYVYQITSVVRTLPGIDALMVALDATDGRGAVSAPAFLPTSSATERAPVGGGDNATFMSWLFGPGLVHGETSPLLIFTSPFLPEFDFLTLQSGQAMAQGLVGSPSDRRLAEVPEPGTMSLLVAGGIAISGRRRRKRGSATPNPSWRR